MKVYLQSGATRYWLVGKDDTPLRPNIDAVVPSRQFQRKSQVASGVSWEEVRVRDRGNDGFMIEVGTFREFTSETDCWNFKFGFSREDAQKPHPMKGDVFFRLELPGGAWIDEKLPNAVINVTSMEDVGVMSVRLRYRIMGGHTVSGFEGSTGTYDWLLDESGDYLLDEDGLFIAGEDHET